MAAAELAVDRTVDRDVGRSTVGLEVVAVGLFGAAVVEGARIERRSPAAGGFAGDALGVGTPIVDTLFAIPDAGFFSSPDVAEASASAEDFVERRATVPGGGRVGGLLRPLTAEGLVVVEDANGLVPAVESLEEAVLEVAVVGLFAPVEVMVPGRRGGTFSVFEDAGALRVDTGLSFEEPSAAAEGFLGLLVAGVSSVFEDSTIATVQRSSYKGRMESWRTGEQSVAGYHSPRSAWCREGRER